jgi:hypothetical protein
MNHGSSNRASKRIHWPGAQMEQDNIQQMINNQQMLNTQQMQNDQQFQQNQQQMIQQMNQ